MPRSKVAPCSVAIEAFPGRLDADQPHVVLEEIGEQADRVGPAADAGDNRIRQAANLLDDLRPRFAADDPLEFAHHGRERMRARRRPQQVMSGLEARRPVAQRFVDRVLERPTAAFHGHHFGAHQLHSEDVELLPLDIVRAHVDQCLEPEQRADDRGGDAMLAGAGLGDQAASCPCVSPAGPGRAPGWSCAHRRGAGPRA